ncbi:MAG: DUF6270 domain-containing protein [Lachnospiraceae bacterium]
MNLVTIGSRVIDDAIVNVTEYNHHNKYRVVGISPFSIYTTFDTSRVVRDSDIKTENAYRKTMFKLDVTKSLIDKIEKTKAEYVCIDFLEAYKQIWQCRLADGRIFRCTHNDLCISTMPVIKANIEKITGSKIVAENVINPLSWTDQQLREEVANFAKALLPVSEDKKIILLDAYMAFQYMENGVIFDTEKLNNVAKYNAFYEKCSKYFRESIKCLEIPSVKFILGGEKYNLFEGMYYTDEYYRYIGRVLLNIEKGSKRTGKIVAKYTDELQEKIDFAVVTSDIVDLKKKIGTDRPCVVIGESKSVNNCLTENGFTIAFGMKYEDAIVDGKLCDRLLEIKDKSNEYVCILPHVKRGDKILELLWQNGYGYMNGAMCFWHDPIQFSGFVGEYFDIYHNYVVSYNPAVKFSILGVGADALIEETQFEPCSVNLNLSDQVKFEFGKNIRADRLIISALAGSYGKIGENTTFADNCTMSFVCFMDIIIGKDCMFSSKIVCHAGDGHSIYNVESSERVNYIREQYDSDKFRIVLGEHVWVGFQAFLLAGTNVGNGSIIGARTVVNKAFPNNVIIAGNPGKVIKKDIGWARDPFTQDIYDNPGALEPEYAKKTIE